MSLRFVIGSSGSGKSQYVFRQTLKRAKEDTRNFLFIVPDQFTMQTQMDLCVNEENDREGIMNIDVLSFSRLSHRVREELGENGGVLLDDTGKNLILRKVAGEQAGNLSVIGAHLSKLGYIHEVKSILSEFYQYAIGDTELEQLITYSKGRALEHKLNDLKIVKHAFEEYIADKYITTEGLTEQLAELCHKSDIVKDSVIILDGFTGFTPIQYKLLRELLHVCSEMIVTLVGENSAAFASMGEHDLFALSASTYQTLGRIATEEKVEVLEDVVLERKTTVRRYKDNAESGAKVHILYIMANFFLLNFPQSPNIYLNLQ